MSYSIKLLKNSIPKINKRNFTSTIIKLTDESIKIKTTTNKIKVPINLISKIRSLRPGTPITLAKEALELNNLDLNKSIEYILNLSLLNGEEKIKKLEKRLSNQGLIGLILNNNNVKGGYLQGSIVELSSETDFVARTEEFKLLLEQITRTLAFFSEEYNQSNSNNNTTTNYFKSHLTSSIENSPLIPLINSNSSLTPNSTPISTIKTSITNLISRLGENINLRRSITFSIPSPNNSITDINYLASKFLHNSNNSINSNYSSGSIGSLLLFKLPPTIEGKIIDELEINKLTRALARQVVAIPTLKVKSTIDVEEEGRKKIILEEGEHSTNLYEQPLITLNSSESVPINENDTVESILKNWSQSKGIQGNGLEVIELERWTVGEDI